MDETLWTIKVLGADGVWGNYSGLDYDDWDLKDGCLLIYLPSREDPKRVVVFPLVSVQRFELDEVEYEDGKVKEK